MLEKSTQALISKGEQEKEKSGQHLTPQNALTAFPLLQIIP